MAVTLKYVNSSKNSWEVVVRITRIWESTNVKNNNEFMSIDMLLLDEEATQLHAKIWKRLAANFRSKIKEGAIYRIRNFRVLENEASFKPVEEKNTIVFLPTSSVKEIIDYAGATIREQKFYFQKMNVIQERLSKNTYLTDVIGLLYGMGEIEKIDVGGVLVDKIELKIDIERDYRLDITLWAEKAKVFTDLILSVEKGPYVIVVTSTLVKTLLGQVKLSSTSATKTYVNMDLPETTEILNTFGAEHAHIVMLKGKISSSIPLAEQTVQNRKTIKELTAMEATKENSNSITVTLHARVLGVQNKFGWYYNSCENCRRKLQPKEKFYHCTSCKQDAVFPNTSYKIELLVADDTGETTLTMFEREGQQILGISSAQLIGHYGASIREVPPQLHNITNRRFIFQLRVTDYNLIYGNEDYTITKVFDTENCGNVKKRGLDGMKVEDTEDEDFISNAEEPKRSKKSLILDSGGNSVAPTEGDNCNFVEEVVP